jgi:hypothetical protein
VALLGTPLVSTEKLFETWVSRSDLSHRYLACSYDQ